MADESPNSQMDWDTVDYGKDAPSIYDDDHARPQASNSDHYSGPTIFQGQLSTNNTTHTAPYMEPPTSLTSTEGLLGHYQSQAAADYRQSQSSTFRRSLGGNNYTSHDPPTSIYNSSIWNQGTTLAQPVPVAQVPRPPTSRPHPNPTLAGRFLPRKPLLSTTQGPNKSSIVRDAPIDSLHGFPGFGPNDTAFEAPRASKHGRGKIPDFKPGNAEHGAFGRPRSPRKSTRPASDRLSQTLAANKFSLQAADLTASSLPRQASTPAPTSAPTPALTPGDSLTATIIKGHTALATIGTPAFRRPTARPYGSQPNSVDWRDSRRGSRPNSSEFDLGFGLRRTSRTLRIDRDKSKRPDLFGSSKRASTTQEAPQSTSSETEPATGQQESTLTPNRPIILPGQFPESAEPTPVPSKNIAAHPATDDTQAQGSPALQNPLASSSEDAPVRTQQAVSVAGQESYPLLPQEPFQTRQSDITSSQVESPSADATSYQPPHVTHLEPSSQSVDTSLGSDHSKHVESSLPPIAASERRARDKAAARQLNDEIAAALIARRQEKLAAEKLAASLEHSLSAATESLENRAENSTKASETIATSPHHQTTAPLTTHSQAHADSNSRIFSHSSNTPTSSSDLAPDFAAEETQVTSSPDSSPSRKRSHDDFAADEVAETGTDSAMMVESPSYWNAVTTGASRRYQRVSEAAKRFAEVHRERAKRRLVEIQIAVGDNPRPYWVRNPFLRRYYAPAALYKSPAAAGSTTATLHRWHTGITGSISELVQQEVKQEPVTEHPTSPPSSPMTPLGATPEKPVGDGKALKHTRQYPDTPLTARRPFFEPPPKSILKGRDTLSKPRQSVAFTENHSLYTYERLDSSILTDASLDDSTGLESDESASDGSSPSPSPASSSNEADKSEHQSQGASSPTADDGVLDNSPRSDFDGPVAESPCVRRAARANVQLNHHTSEDLSSSPPGQQHVQGINADGVDKTGPAPQLASGAHSEGSSSEEGPVPQQAENSLDIAPSSELSPPVKKEENEEVASLQAPDTPSKYWMRNRTPKQQASSVKKRDPRSATSKVLPETLDRTLFAPGADAPSPVMNMGGNRIGSRKEKEAAAIQGRLEALRLQEATERAWHDEEEKARLAKELEEQELKRRSYRTEPKHKVITPISSDWQAKLATAMAHHVPGKVLAKYSTGTSDIELTRKDFGTLLPQSGTNDAAHGWLNDEIVNAAVRHTVQFCLEKTNHKRGNTPKFHSFSSAFWTTVDKQTVKGVARWAKRAKIDSEKLLNVEYLFIPINQGGSHWTLMAVMPSRKRAEYFDSFGQDGKRYLNIIKDYLRQELGDKFVEDEWDFAHGISPVQTNGRDCGVFSITNARMIAMGLDPEKSFGQQDIDMQRKRIACELLNGGLTGVFEPTEYGAPGLTVG